jgi:serine/threonine-protein kinase
MFNSNPNELVGQQIEQYEIHKHIARGGMADVYLARDVTLERLVALKIMLPALAANDDFVARFQREAQIVARLEHPNIVQIYSIGQTRTNRPYLAMQYIEGGSLQDTLAQLEANGELLDTHQALGIINKMADALRVAHEAGIIHRDLKPSNILIRLNGEPVLVDLGIAVVQGGPKLTHTGTLIGTPHYMSPEQASGKPLDGRSDIYSLGVILYEMLAGRKPFAADDPLAVLHMHAYEQPPPLAEIRPDLHPETQLVVETCLQKTPDYRYPAAAALQLGLRRAIQAEGGTGTVSPSGAWRPHPSSEYRLHPSQVGQPPAPPARRPTWLYALIPIGIILLLLGVYALVNRPFTITSTPAATAVTLNPTATSTSTTALVVVSTSTLASLPELTPSATNTAAPTETPVPITPTPLPDVGPETLTIGQSVLDVPLTAVRLGAGPNSVIFIGGLHAGFAPGTVSLAEQAVAYFSSDISRVPPSVTLYIITNANPDSPDAPGELDGRLNANQVDLNRNWDCDWLEDATFRGEVVPNSGGPFPFSEPETVALRDFILDKQAQAVIFWEARASGGLSTPGQCTDNSQTSFPLSQVYGEAAGYEVADFEEVTDQVLNGDSANWLDGQGIPAIGVLLPDYTGMDWGSNLAGMLAVLAYYDVAR